MRTNDLCNIYGKISNGIYPVSLGKLHVHGLGPHLVASRREVGVSGALWRLVFDLFLYCVN